VSPPKVVARPGRSPVNEQRYGEIVEAAGRLFAEKGFDGTSLQDISVAVGVLKGSLYHYITSKEDLLAEVVRVGQQGITENLELCNHFKGEPLEQLVAFAYGHVVLNATPDRLIRGVVYLRDGDKLSQEKRDELIKRRDEYDRYLRSILRSGQERGLVDPDVNPRTCSFAILGVVTSYIRWYHPGGPMSTHELGREFAAFSLAAVREHLGHGPGHRWEIVDEVIERCQAFLGARAEDATDGQVDQVVGASRRSSSR